MTRRFDPRAVTIGVVILIGTAAYMTVVGQQAVTTAGRTAAPVSQVCDAGGPAAAALVATVVDGVNGCQAADDAGRIGPFATRSATPGTNGTNGVDGATGAPGAPATPAPPLPAIPGTNGTNGADGTSPACLAEPGQCRGADATPAPAIPGAPGTNGTNGAAPACLSEPDQCRGPAGRGIADTQVVDCRLIVFYTDNTSRDAGPVCATNSGPEPPDPATEQSPADRPPDQSAPAGE